jgi:hypothetical protein
MNSEEAPLKAPESEFVIELSGFMLFMKRFLQLGAILVFLGGVTESFRLRSPMPLVATALNGFIYLALAAFAIRTFPRKVSLEGDSIIFHKVPTTWIDIGPILLPLGITQRLVRPKSSVALEWIGRSLTLNDMNEGKSVRLASGKHADKLAAWFSAIGAATPVGG